MAALVTHGKHGTYVNHRCRCAPCTAANAAWQRFYIKRQRAHGLCVECHRETGGFARCAIHRAAVSRRVRPPMSQRVYGRAVSVLCFTSRYV